MQIKRITTISRRWLVHIFKRAILLGCISLSMITTPLLANHEANEFSSPDSPIAMQESWVNSKIEYHDDAAGADIVMVLDQQTYPAFASDIKLFAEKQGIKLVLHSGTCGISANGLVKKNIDIGGYCCPPGKGDRLPGLVFHTIGIAPIAIMVNQRNLIGNVTSRQAKNIFSGEIFRWSELKSENGDMGQNIPIQVIARLHCKSRPGHWKLILDNEEKFSPRLREVGTIKDMVSQISSNTSAIGYETEWMMKFYQKEKTIKHVTINDRSPADKDAMLKADYPFYRTYNLAYWENKSLRKPFVDKLIVFMEKLVQEKGEKYGIIPSSDLRNAGWLFSNNELISEPERVHPDE